MDPCGINPPFIKTTPQAPSNPPNKRLLLRVNSEVLKDTYREKALPNKTPALTKSTNIEVWVIGTSNQLFMRDI